MRKFYIGMVGDIKNLEAQFSEMAEKGWMIEKIGFITHQYKAAEPCKLRFFVDLLPQITAFDYPENEDAMDYRAMCEASDWKFVTASKQLHIFCAEESNPEPIPIHTDNSINARIYIKQSIKTELLIYLFLLPVLMMNFFFGIDEGFLLFGLSFFNVLGLFLFLPAFIWMTGFAVSWCLRARKAAKNNLPLPRVNRKLAKIRNACTTMGLLLLLICDFTGFAYMASGAVALFILPLFGTPVLAVGTGFWIRRRVETIKRTRQANKKMFIAAIVIVEILFFVSLSLTVHLLLSQPQLDRSSLDGRPALTLADVGTDAPADFSSVRIEGSPLVPVVYECFEIGEDGSGSVNTHVYKSLNGTVAKTLYKELTKKFTERMDDLKEMAGERFVPEDEYKALSHEEAAFWGAEKGLWVYREYETSKSVELLIINGETILHISADGDNLDLDTLSEAVKALY